MVSPVVRKSAIARPSPRAITLAQFEQLERSLAGCTERVTQLERELQISTQRMGAMQAEIDHLRARKIS